MHGHGAPEHAQSRFFECFACASKRAERSIVERELEDESSELRRLKYSVHLDEDLLGGRPA